MVMATDFCCGWGNACIISMTPTFMKVDTFPEHKRFYLQEVFVFDIDIGTDIDIDIDNDIDIDIDIDIDKAMSAWWLVSAPWVLSSFS